MAILVYRTQILYGKLDTTTTSASGPSLAGNITAIVISFLVCTIWTWVAPDKVQHRHKPKSEPVLRPSTAVPLMSCGALMVSLVSLCPWADVPLHP